MYAPHSTIYAALGKLALFMRGVLDRPVRSVFSIVALAHLLFKKPRSLKGCMFYGLFARAQLDRADIQDLRGILNARERALDAPIEQTSAETDENVEGKRL